MPDNRRTEVFVTCQFEGFHCWPEAPDEFAYLRTIHRHIFHVRLHKEVKHNDRDIEFIELKRQVLDYCLKTYGSGHDQAPRWSRFSCEDVAHDLFSMFNATRVEVSEDGENGTIVTVLPESPF
jgi:hypothetical protein